MGGGYYKAEAQAKPWIESVRPIMEAEAPVEVLRQTLTRFPLSGKQIALDDRTWARSVLAIRQCVPDAEFTLASELLASMRSIKSTEELALMRKAGEIVEGAFERAL